MKSYCQMTITIDIYLQNDAENLYRSACLWLLFLVTFYDLAPTLTFLGMTAIIMQYLS